MSNSQNKKNEQQNNLCITLTEQWKKGELKSGWYFVKVGNYEAEIDLYDDDQNQWFNCCDKDIYPVEILAPVPSYEEWQKLQSSWVDEMGKAVDLQKALEWSNEQYNTKVPVLESENQQLKELLKECKSSVLFEADVMKETSGKHSKDYKMLASILTKIDNAIGEKK